MEGRRENEAGDEDGSKDENESGGGQSGLEHAHDELSWILRGTQYENNPRRRLAFLPAQISNVDNLNAGRTRHFLNIGRQSLRR